MFVYWSTVKGTVLYTVCQKVFSFTLSVIILVQKTCTVYISRLENNNNFVYLGMVTLDKKTIVYLGMITLNKIKKLWNDYLLFMVNIIMFRLVIRNKYVFSYVFHVRGVSARTISVPSIQRNYVVVRRYYPVKVISSGFLTNM